MPFRLDKEILTHHNQLNEPKIDKLAVENAPKSDHKSLVEIELESLEAKLRTVQLALEVLTGACATLPDPESGVDVDAKVDEEEDDDADGGLYPS